MTTLSAYKSANSLSLRELAARLDLSKSYTNEILRGEKSPSLATALQIHEATGGAVEIASLVKSPSAPSTSREAS